MEGGGVGFRKEKGKVYLTVAWRRFFFFFVATLFSIIFFFVFSFFDVFDDNNDYICNDYSNSQLE